MDVLSNHRSTFPVSLGFRAVSFGIESFFSLSFFEDAKIDYRSWVVCDRATPNFLCPKHTIRKVPPTHPFLTLG